MNLTFTLLYSTAPNSTRRNLAVGESFKGRPEGLIVCGERFGISGPEGRSFITGTVMWTQAAFGGVLIGTKRSIYLLK
jgi:hypothetical protein